MKSTRLFIITHNIAAAQELQKIIAAHPFVIGTPETYKHSPKDRMFLSFTNKNAAEQFAKASIPLIAYGLRKNINFQQMYRLRSQFHLIALTSTIPTKAEQTTINLVKADNGLHITYALNNPAKTTIKKSTLQYLFNQLGIYYVTPLMPKGQFHFQHEN